MRLRILLLLLRPRMPLKSQRQRKAGLEHSASRVRPRRCCAANGRACRRKTPTATMNDLKFGRNPAEAITKEPGLEGVTVSGLRDGVAKRMNDSAR